MRNARQNKQLEDFIKSCADSKAYLIGIFQKKYEEKCDWAQEVPVDQIAYYSATGDQAKVRNLIRQKDRESAERNNPKSPPPKPEKENVDWYEKDQD